MSEKTLLLERTRDAEEARGMRNHVQARSVPVVVLLVEDDPLVRAVTVQRFHDAGLVVIEADDAHWAIAILEANAQFIQVLFTDIVLPGSIDGVSLASCVRARWPWLAVAITSGNAAPDDLPNGVRFFPKPFAAEQVVEHIRELALA
jgi:DNA-binding NtrC family response regulator